MHESEDGTVTGSIDASKLDEVEPKTDEAKAQIAQLKAEAQAAEEQAEAGVEQASQGTEAQQGVETPTDDQPVTTEAGEVAQPAAEEATYTDEDVDALRAEAMQLGVKVDGRWGYDRLRTEVEAAREG